MKKVAIIQARMTSTRLPGKVLMDLAGKPLLAQEIARVRRCRRVDEIVVATTCRATDDPVADLAEKEGVRWYRGSEEDVLSRYVEAAREAKAEIVIRLTSDCPLLDPWQTDRVVLELEDHAHDCDYASNVVRRTFPRGLDTEALFLEVLERAHAMAASKPAREHVTYFIHTERPDLFSIRSVTDTMNNADLRWTVDTPEDLAMVRRIYAEMRLPDRWADYPMVVAHVRSHPEIAAMNMQFSQKAV